MPLCRCLPADSDSGARLLRLPPICLALRVLSQEQEANQQARNRTASDLCPFHAWLRALACLLDRTYVFFFWEPSMAITPDSWPIRRAVCMALCYGFYGSLSWVLAHTHDSSMAQSSFITKMPYQWPFHLYQLMLMANAKLRTLPWQLTWSYGFFGNETFFIWESGHTFGNSMTNTVCLRYQWLLYGWVPSIFISSYPWPFHASKFYIAFLLKKFSNSMQFLIIQWHLLIRIT